MTMKNNPIGRQKDIVMQELSDEVLLYDLLINKAYCLNPTSAIVWKLCDGNHTVSDITNSLTEKLKLPANEVLVWMALEQLKNENLLANGENIGSPFRDLSRRDAIRKVGFASLIALPLISSLIAPIAAQAGSGTPTCANPRLTSCTTNNDCISNDPSGADTCSNNCCIFGPAVPGGGCPPGQIIC